MNSVERELTENVLAWPGTVATPHRFDAVEWKVGGKEVGHFHRLGQLDIPFTKVLGQQLISEGKAGTHHWVPESRWVGYKVRNQGDAAHALWLLRISYLYKALTVRGERPLPLQDIKEELCKLGLSEGLNSVMEPIVARYLGVKSRELAT